MNEAASKAAAAAEVAFRNEVETLLIPGEAIQQTIKMFEDYLAFTDKRIIFVDKKFIGSSRAIVSIPYSKITEVGMTSGGFMKFSQELAIQVGSHRHEFKVYDAKQTGDAYREIMARIL